MERLLTIEEIAQALRRSKSSLSRDRASGDGPAFVRLPSGQIRYPESAVCKWVEQNTVQGAA